MDNIRKALLFIIITLFIITIVQLNKINEYKKKVEIVDQVEHEYRMLYFSRFLHSIIIDLNEPDVPILQINEKVRLAIMVNTIPNNTNQYYEELYEIRMLISDVYEEVMTLVDVLEFIPEREYEQFTHDLAEMNLTFEEFIIKKDTYEQLKETKVKILEIKERIQKQINRQSISS